MIHQLTEISLFIFLLIITTGQSQNPLIVGHRGSSFTMPENTVASAIKAWEEGADAVEIDVYPTSDKKIVVIHDKSTKRTTGADHIATETNSNVLTSLDAGIWKGTHFKGEHIPLLPDIMNVIPRYKKLVVEVKSGPEIIPLLQDLLHNHSKRSQIIFIAFDWDVIKGLKEAFPDLPCFWLSAKKFEVQSRWSEIKPARLDGINLHHSIIDKDLITKAHKDDLGVLCWTVDEMDEVKRLMSIGIDGITTNRPGYVRDQLLREMNFEK